MEWHSFKPKFILEKGVADLGIFTTVKIAKGKILFEMSGEILSHPTRTTIQIGKNKHIEDDIGAHINHHCTPNARINKKNLTFISLKEIEIGEEITFDYNRNEDLLAAPFNCHCCSKPILGKLGLKIKA